MKMILKGFSYPRATDNLDLYFTGTLFVCSAYLLYIEINFTKHFHSTLGHSKCKPIIYTFNIRHS